jgi:hypothetical protein
MDGLTVRDLANLVDRLTRHQHGVGDPQCPYDLLRAVPLASS